MKPTKERNRTGSMWDLYAVYALVALAIIRNHRPPLDATPLRTFMGLLMTLFLRDMRSYRPCSLRRDPSACWRGSPSHSDYRSAATPAPRPGAQLHPLRDTEGPGPCDGFSLLHWRAPAIAQIRRIGLTAEESVHIVFRIRNRAAAERS